MIGGISFSSLITQLFMGLQIGMVYVMLAIGLSLIFGLMTVVNFAHGAFFMFGAYMGLFMMGLTGNFWLSLVFVPVATGLLGLVVERFTIRPLYGRDLNYPLLLTFGLSFVMIEGVRLIWGTGGSPFNTPSVLTGPVNLGFALFPKYRVFVIVVTALIVLGLWLFLEKTNLGLVIRAGTRDSIIVRVLGVDISRVWFVVFGIGTALAGVAGLLVAPMRGVHPDMGIGMLIECFVVVVVGGMGSILGAVVAGLLIGEVVSMVSMFYPMMGEVAIFIFMAIVLLIRPSGLFGEVGLLE
jgi:branched-chain amino acid transport system permease protein